MAFDELALTVVRVPLTVRLLFTVEEAEEMKPPVRVVRVATATEPVKLATEEIVWELMRPEVMVFKVALEENRLVELAVVAKRLVVVALVEVDSRAVKFDRVEEAEINIPMVVVGRSEFEMMFQSLNWEFQYSKEVVENEFPLLTDRKYEAEVVE